MDAECQKAPSTKRCIKTGYGVSPLLGVLCVRKQRAPNGALKRDLVAGREAIASGQKTPSAKRGIKTQTA